MRRKTATKKGEETIKEGMKDAEQGVKLVKDRKQPRSKPVMVGNTEKKVAASPKHEEEADSFTE